MTPTETIVPVETQIAAIESTATVDQIAEAWTRVQGLKRQIADFEREAKDRIIAWMLATDRDDVRWKNGPDSEFILYLGHARSVKCKDVPKACEKILTVCEGDWERFTNCLSSGAIKHGTVRKLLKEKKQEALYDELFVEEVKSKLEDGSPKPKELQSVDTKFMR